MSKLLAFQVAKPVVGVADVAVPEGYDAALQALVWEGEDTASMASAVCTRIPAGYSNCSGGGTACRMSGGTCIDPWFSYCYTCDY